MFDSIRLNGVYYGPLNINGQLVVDASNPVAALIQVGNLPPDDANVIDPVDGSSLIAFYPQLGFTGNNNGAFFPIDFETYTSGVGNLTGTIYTMINGFNHGGSGILSNAYALNAYVGNAGIGSITNATGILLDVMEGANNVGIDVANFSGATGNISYRSSQNSGTGCFAFRGLGTAPSKLEGTMSATGYLVGATAGIDASITSANLVGKTLTVVKGIVTAFA